MRVRRLRTQKSALKALQHEYFQLVVIQNDAGKVDHLKKLVELHNIEMVENPIEFKDILFFDDMWHNIAKKNSVFMLY